MGAKKKEEKKQEDIVDISTLPQCKTVIATVNWHGYLSGLIKYLKLQDYKVISREDLLAILKEKTLDPTAKNLASVCKGKIEELELPLRKEKKDTPRTDYEKIDLLIVLKGYPLTSEETLDLDATDSFIDTYLYMRPTPHHQATHFKRKTEFYNQKLQELTASNSDTSALNQPVLPSIYPESLLEFYKLSTTKKNYKNAIIKVREFESEEDLEVKEEVKEEKEEAKKKDAKPLKKGEEPKEEEIDVNDPRLKFCNSFVEEIKNFMSEKSSFENWVKGIKLVPLFPESLQMKTSRSQVSIGSDKKNEVVDKKEISLDDGEKDWDFAYYFKCINEVPEIACGTETVLSCILRHLSRNSLQSKQFFSADNENDSIRILTFNNHSQIKAENLKFYLSENLVSESLLSSLRCLNVPGIHRYMMNEPMPEAEKASETTSILSFSSCSSRYFERALSIFAFENMLKKIQKERSWDFGGRVYEEILPLEDFYQKYLKLMEFDPEVLTEYIARTDSLLLCVFFKTPPGRIIRKAWKSSWKVAPNFSQYMSIFSGTPDSVFYDIDPNLVGLIKERSKIMYPADNSVIKMIEYHIGSKKKTYQEKPLNPRYRPIVYKDGWYFGLRKFEKNEFWAVFQNERILAEMGENGLELNFTLDNGLLVKVLPGGEVLQQKPGTEEENRIIFPSGAIAKHFSNGSIVMLMPSGEVSQMTKEKLWTITNNKGKKLAKRQHLTYPMDPIKTISQIDAETLAKVTIREDLVMTLKFQDNSFAVFHEDGTRMHTSADKNTIYIESPGFAPIRIYKDLIKARQNTVIGLGSSDSGLGAEDIMLRSNDGVLIETYLPNHTKIQSFVQKQELEAYNEFSTNRINLVRRGDGTILKSSQNGEIVFITTESREALAESSGPDAYFYNIFTVPEERNSGVYTVRVDAGKLFTKDNEGNYFEVSTQGKAIEKLAVSLNVEDIQPESPHVSDGEYIDPECKFLPPPASIIPPRLFIIKDNTATELLEHSQLDYHFKHSTGKYTKENNKEFDMHTWIHLKTENSEYIFPGSPFLKYSLPKIVSPMLQSLLLSPIPKPISYVNRRVKEFQVLDEEKRKKIKGDLEKFSMWKENKAKKLEALRIVDPRNDQEKAKFEMFLQRVNLLKGGEEVKEEKEDSDRISEFVVELSDEEIEPIRVGNKVSSFKMEGL